MRLYIIRHGDPNYEKDCLTDCGKMEAEALAAYAPRMGIAHIYASPMGRAQETAQPTAKALGLPIHTLEWTRELGGVYYDIPGYRRCSPFGVPGEVLYRETPEPLYDGWNERPYCDDPLYTQHVEQIEKGSDALLLAHGYRREGRLYHCDAPNEDRIAVFCHHGLTATWLAHLLTLPIQAAWAGLWLAPTSVTTILMERHSEVFAVPRALAIGDTSHIRRAGLADNERGFFETP